MVGYAKIQNTPDGLATVCNSSGGVMPGSRGDERAGPAGISTKEGGGGGRGANASECALPLSSYYRDESTHRSRSRKQLLLVQFWQHKCDGAFFQIRGCWKIGFCLWCSHQGPVQWGNAGVRENYKAKSGSRLFESTCLSHSHRRRRGNKNWKREAKQFQRIEG